VTWRVFLTDSSRPHLDALTPADRSAITEELFARVTSADLARALGRAGVDLFEDRPSSASESNTFVNEKGPRVGVVSVRRS